MPALSFVFRATRTAVAVACAVSWLPGNALAAPTSPAAEGLAPASAPPNNSNLDAPLFYQLLIGEMEFRSGEIGTAYQVMLDAARKTRDETLFRRATEMALQARAGEQALQAVQAWRTATPMSLEALRYHVQLTVALNRPVDSVEPLRTLLQLSPPIERPGLIASLPRMFSRMPDKRQAAQLMEQILQPSVATPGTAASAQAALGRAWLAA